MSVAQIIGAVLFVVALCLVVWWITRGDKVSADDTEELFGNPMSRMDAAARRWWK